jgi:hypothetical protein
MQDKIFRLIPEQHGNIKSAAHTQHQPPKKNTWVWIQWIQAELVSTRERERASQVSESLRKLQK